MGPHPGLDATTTSSSSHLSSFPPLSRSQRARIERTLAHLPRDATTWADLTQAQGRLTEADREGDDSDGMYELWLKLVWQQGVTWHDKWAAVQPQTDGEHALDPPRRHHRRRPSDNLDLLRQKLDRVALDPLSGRPAERSKSTPPRPLLVHRPTVAGAGGYSSSDDQFAGVPTPRARRSSLLEARLAARRRPEDAATTDDDGRVLHSRTRASFVRTRPSNGGPDDLLPSSTTTPHHSTPAPPRRQSVATPRPAPVALSPPPPAPLSPSRHPLLHARLSALPPRSPPLRRAPASGIDLDGLATSFSRLRLLLPSFSHWTASARFHAQREADLTHRRAAWLARCALRTWRARANGVRALDTRAADAARVGEARRTQRAARTALAAWRARRAERDAARADARRADERRDKERVLREARDAVAALSARRAVQRALERWRERARDARAARFRVLALGRGALGVWREKAARRREGRQVLEEVAAEQWCEWEAKRSREVWDWWVRRTAWTVKEREVRRQQDGDLKREVWDVWSDKKRQADHDAYLMSLAVAHHAGRLACSAVSAWRVRLSRLDSLLALSTAHQSTLLTRRATSDFKTWRLSTRLKLLSHTQAHTLASSALAAWTGAYEHLEIELAGRADALLARKGAQLRVVAFSAWADATAQRARLARAAAGVDRARVLRTALGRWRAREARERVQERKADVVRDFMQVRGAWKHWCEVAWEGRRARWAEARRTARKREALGFWLAQTRQKSYDERLVALHREKQEQRLRANSVQVWKSRVIARKSLEQDASAFFDRKAVLAGFRRWTEQTYAAEDRLVLANEHRAVKLEELRDRAFHAWLASARRASALRERYVAFASVRDGRTKESKYHTWRERSLARVEREAVRRRDAREKEEAWAWWKGRTKTLVAVQHYNRMLALRTLEAWRVWTTPPEQVLRGVETDHRAITSGALQVWRIKTGAKRALKTLSGRMRLGTSPNASPPTRPSPSIHLASPAPSPAPPPPRIAVPVSMLARVPPGQASGHAAPSSPPSSMLSSSARPRLAAEYAGSSPSSSSPSPTPHPQPWGRPWPRPRPRPRSQSLASRLSAGARVDARSAGAGGRVSLDSPSESESEAEAETNSEDERDAAGPGARARARSEGARDVRGEYAALRARLRAAAAGAGAGKTGARVGASRAA
ncbi:hypothetical protein JCM3770_002714 [Rhodotorula araucariae]